MASLVSAAFETDPLLGPSDPREKLELLQRQLEADRAAQQKRDTEKSRLASETKRLQTESIAAAAKIRGLEQEEARLEAELARLNDQETRAANAFALRRDKLSGLLSVLQRMSREPPPALAVAPGDAAAAARSAIILTAVLPGVRDEAKALNQELGQLRKLRKAAADASVVLARSREALRSEHVRIGTLLAEKAKLTAALIDEHNAAETRLKTLAREAMSMEALVARVDGGATTMTEAGFSQQQFDALRGQLQWPATGELAARFGEMSDNGVRNTALSLRTRPKAQIVSPVDGKILFAEPFKEYGQLLIIGAGDGYHVLLLGMARIDARVGQVLLTGEPIGVMGDFPTSPEQQPGRLRIEVRHNGEPVDPGPWFAGDNTNSRDKG